LIRDELKKSLQAMPTTKQLELFKGVLEFLSDPSKNNNDVSLVLTEASFDDPHLIARDIHDLLVDENHVNVLGPFAMNLLDKNPKTLYAIQNFIEHGSHALIDQMSDAQWREIARRGEDGLEELLALDEIFSEHRQTLAIDHPSKPAIEASYQFTQHLLAQARSRLSKIAPEVMPKLTAASSGKTYSILGHAVIDMYQLPLKGTKRAPLHAMQTISRRFNQIWNKEVLDMGSDTNLKRTPESATCALFFNDLKRTRYEIAQPGKSTYQPLISKPHLSAEDQLVEALEKFRELTQDNPEQIFHLSQIASQHVANMFWRATHYARYLKVDKEGNLVATDQMLRAGESTIGVITGIKVTNQLSRTEDGKIKLRTVQATHGFQHVATRDKNGNAEPTEIDPTTAHLLIVTEYLVEADGTITPGSPAQIFLQGTKVKE